VIYFICPDINGITGGILMLYRQVDVLNKNNFSAAVVHDNPGFRCNWFENTTRIVYSRGLQFARDDVVVIPEFLGPGIARIAPGIRKVILNQNCYLTFNNHSLDPNNRETPYLNREVIATITGSEDSASYLRYAFPRHNVYRIRYGIDRSLFHPQADKRPQIAFLPRRNYQDALQVFSILKFRGQLAGFDIRPIDKMSYRETAALMRQSAIFFSFSNIEGFGLPPAEALASGCITIGYHGRGGKEFLRPEFSYPIEFGDIEGYARTAEMVLKQYRSDPAPLLKQVVQGSAFVASTYSPENENSDIVNSWRQILALADKV